MNINVRYGYKRFLIKSLSSSCLMATFLIGTAFSLPTQAVLYAVPDGPVLSVTKSLFFDTRIPKNTTNLADSDFNENLFGQMQNMGWYPNPMLVYNLLAVGQLIRHMQTSTISSLDLTSRQNYYDSEYSVPMWGEDVSFTIKVGGSKPTENTWDILESSSGENSMVGVSLDGNSLAVALEAEYALNSDMNLGLSYMYLSSKRFGNKSTKTAEDSGDTVKYLDSAKWKAVRAELSHHLFSVSGSMQLSDMVMGLHVWGSIGYGFGDQKSQRHVSVDYSDVGSTDNVLVGTVTSGNIVALNAVTESSINAAAEVPLETSAKITQSNIGSSMWHVLAGARFSFPVMDQVRIIPSIEMNYNSYSIDAYSEHDDESLPTIGANNVGAFLSWLFGIAGGEIDFHQLKVMAKVPFDFNMDMDSGSMNLGFYPVVQMEILGEESIDYPISALPADSSTAYDVDIRMGNRSFNPGLGFYLNFAGTENWHMFVDYELLVLDNDLSHTGRIVFSFSI